MSRVSVSSHEIKDPDIAAASLHSVRHQVLQVRSNNRIRIALDISGFDALTRTIVTNG